MNNIIFLLIIIYLAYLLLNPIDYEGFSNDSETIFVSVPSYRDIDCKNTLYSIFEKAKNPELVYVGVFEQNEISNSDESCRVNSKWNNNIRYKIVDYKEAKGPFYARAIINNNLYKGEKYYLMIDSHTLFIQDWDIRMKNQLNFLRSYGIKKPIISTYPHHLDLSKNNKIENEKRDVTTLICDVIGAKEYPTEALSYEKPSGKFYKSMLLGAGYIFTYSEFFNEIRMDSSLEHIFSGEELLLALMAYTHGWDIYSPAYLNVFHYYNHKKPSWHKEVIQKNDNDRKIEKMNYEKLRNLVINCNINDGFGNNRNIKQFWNELGFDGSKKTLKEKFPESSKHKRCYKPETITYPYEK